MNADTKHRRHRQDRPGLMVTTATPNGDAIRWPFETMPLRRFCDFMGYNEPAIRARIDAGHMIEGREFKRDRLKQIHIIISGWDHSWVGVDQKQAS